MLKSLNSVNPNPPSSLCRNIYPMIDMNAFCISTCDPLELGKCSSQPFRRRLWDSMLQGPCCLSLGEVLLILNFIFESYL